MHSYSDIARNTQLNSNHVCQPQSRTRTASVIKAAVLSGIMTLGLASYAGAQTAKPSTPYQYNPTTCWVFPNGGNGCMSPQYRSGATSGGYNANLSGSPRGDKNVINLGNVSQLTLLNSIPSPWVAQNPGFTEGGCQQGGLYGQPLLPTASPSIESRILFPALDGNGNCALFTYDVTFPTGAQFVAELGANPNVTSSPGYVGSNSNVVIAAEDGNVYAYEWASNTLAWTYSSGTGNPIDASPTTWPNVDGIYIVDNGGVISKIDPDNGTLDSTWQSNGGPIHSSVLPGGATVSASSVSVSTCGGQYPACTMLFVAGQPNNLTYTGVVKAYNSATGSSTPAWSSAITNPATSSPVVSDSQGLVYVQSSASFDGRNYTGALLYALDQNSGTNVWTALPSSVPPRQPQFPPCANGTYTYSSASSPAYDESQKQLGPVLVMSYSYTYTTPCGPLGSGSYVSVYNATRGGGQAMCSYPTSHPITVSSPEVVDGIIYIGTDDGYVLAYDETCKSGSQPIWTSDQMLKSDSTPDPLAGPPVVSYNRIHAVTESGALYVWHQSGH